MGQTRIRDDIGYKLLTPELFNGAQLFTNLVFYILRTQDLRFLYCNMIKNEILIHKYICVSYILRRFFCCLLLYPTLSREIPLNFILFHCRLLFMKTSMLLQFHPSHNIVYIKNCIISYIILTFSRKN